MDDLFEYQPYNTVGILFGLQFALVSAKIVCEILYLEIRGFYYGTSLFSL